MRHIAISTLSHFMSAKHLRDLDEVCLVMRHSETLALLFPYAMFQRFQTLAIKLATAQESATPEQLRALLKEADEIQKMFTVGEP